MLHLVMKKFPSHPSTKDIPFKRPVVIYPGAPVHTINEVYLNILINLCNNDVD